MQKTLSRKIFNTLLLLSLTIFAMWFALKDDYQEVLKNLKQMPLYWVIIILGLGVVYYVIQGIILFYIGRIFKPDMRLKDGINNAYIAAFFNGVTPLGGGQVAQTYAFRKLNMQFSDIASILWMDFFIFQSVVLIYAGSLILLRFSYALQMIPHYIPLIIAGFLINSSVVIALWTMTRFPNFYTRISNFILRILHRLRIIKDIEHVSKRWQKQLTYFQKEIKNFKRHPRLIMKCVCLYTFRQTLFYALPFIIASAMGLPLNFYDLFNLITLSSFIHMLNALTPLPGDTGWTETAFILLFGIVLGKVDASSIMILWRMSTYHLNVLIGGCIFIRVKQKKSILKNS